MKLLITTQAIDKNDPILGFFHRWVEEFAKHFEHVYVICLREGEHSLPANVSVYSLGKENGESRVKYVWRFYIYFSHIFFQERVDFVFFHMGAIYNILASPFFLLRKITGTQFFWWKTHGKLTLLGKCASVFVDTIVTAGNASFNMATTKVHVVGHAIDTQLFTLHPRSNDHTSIRMVIVGRVTPIKKIEIAFDTLTSLKKIGNRSVCLDVYGPVVDMQYKQMLDTLIITHNLENEVFFKGSVKQYELAEIYAQYDVLLHPAYEAGFDKVVLEAMASGVIPITSIKSFETMLKPFGLYVDAQDVDGYVVAIQTITALTLQERETLVTMLRSSVVHDHSVTTLPSRIFGLLA